MTIMSRGLGQIQRKILDFFNSEYAKKYDKEGTSVSFLCGWVFDCKDEVGDLVRLPGGEWWQRKEPTNAQYQSFCRSLRQLQKRGMVEITKIPCRNGSAYRDRDRHDQRGGQSYYNFVKCLIHGDFAMNSTLRKQDNCLVHSHLSLDSTLKEGA